MRSIALTPFFSNVKHRRRHEKLTYHDDLFFFEVSVVEYRAFCFRKYHTASLAFEHLVAFGVEPFLNDVSYLLLPVVRTVRIQTYLVIGSAPVIESIMWSGVYKGHDL